MNIKCDYTYYIHLLVNLWLPVDSVYLLIVLPVDSLTCFRFSRFFSLTRSTSASNSGPTPKPSTPSGGRKHSLLQVGQSIFLLEWGTTTFNVSKLINEEINKVSY